MGGGDGDSESCGVAGDGGVADGGDEESGFSEFGGECDGGGCAADVPGDDGGGGGFVEEADVFPEFGTQAGAFGGSDDGEGLGGGGGLGGRRGGGVDEGSCAVDQQVDPWPGGGDVSAGDSGGFAECAHVEVDQVADGGVFRHAHAGGAEDAEGVCLVYHEEGVVGFGECGDFFQGGGVSVHAEDGFGDYEGALPGGGFFCGGG